MVAPVTITQKSPINVSRSVPNGTGFRLVSDLTCSRSFFSPPMLKHMTSTPLAFLDVGIAFQPSAESRWQTQNNPALPTICGGSFTVSCPKATSSELN